jgi:hypothetical protein
MLLPMARIKNDLAVRFPRRDDPRHRPHLGTRKTPAQRPLPIRRPVQLIEERRRQTRVIPQPRLVQNLRPHLGVRHNTPSMTLIQDMDEAARSDRAVVPFIGGADRAAPSE